MSSEVPPPADVTPPASGKTKAGKKSSSGHKKSNHSRTTVVVFVLSAVALGYLLALLGVHLLAESATPLPPLDLSQGGGETTIVQLRLEELKPVRNRLAINVVVYPGVAQYDNRFDLLADDVAVRLYPASDLGDLRYPKGLAPAQLSTSIEAYGNPTNWPFDTYTTERLAADAFVGRGDAMRKVPARVDVTGALSGWDVTVSRVRDPSVPPTSRAAENGDVVITLHRSKGPLMFDLGICAVLISLPTLALLVAILMALGKRKFLPPFGTWFAAMLFAVVPLRNFLSGAPPAGALIDQAVTLWVLIGLATAMTLYIVAWLRHEK